ncbi:MAG: K(+)/H(+) antiporter [Pycnora praestabilis]|nr:MAG: K(+)/H(+) antiporter [Pycnora praestabilis]
MPSLFNFITLLGGDSSASPNPKIHRLKADTIAGMALCDNTAKPKSITLRKQPLQVHGVRLLELTDRTSTLMKVSKADEYAVRDPVVNVFRTFGYLNNVAVSGDVAIVPASSFADTLIEQASDVSSDLILIPWSEIGSMSESHSLLPDNIETRFVSGSYTHFENEALTNATCNTAIFNNDGFDGPARDGSKTLLKPLQILPVFGGTDDRLALRFVLQLAQIQNITPTLIQFENPGIISIEETSTSNEEGLSHTKSDIKRAEVTVNANRKERDAAFFASPFRHLTSRSTNTRSLRNDPHHKSPHRDTIAPRERRS